MKSHGINQESVLCDESACCSAFIFILFQLKRFVQQQMNRGDCHK